MSESKSSGGVGFIGLLQLMFIGLKLCNQIQWSWWLVFSPTLAVVAFLGLLFVFAVIFALLTTSESEADEQQT